MMHRPTQKPACWTRFATPRPSRYATAPWGEALACQQAATPEAWEIALNHTPPCAGCDRAGLAIAKWTTDQRQRWYRMQQERLK